jgi:hypothetical protein
VRTRNQRGRLAGAVFGAVIVVPALIGCASRLTAGTGVEAPPSGSLSTQPVPPTNMPPTNIPPPGATFTRPASRTITAPHIVCYTGSHAYTFDGASRPTEICLRLGATATITVSTPAGRSWQAPRVTDPTLLTPSAAGVIGQSARITVHAVATGATTVTISRSGVAVWSLVIAISP